VPFACYPGLRPRLFCIAPSTGKISLYTEIRTALIPKSEQI
jgi:hypothetical protein